MIIPDKDFPGKDYYSLKGIIKNRGNIPGIPGPNPDTGKIGRENLKIVPPSTQKSEIPETMEVVPRKKIVAAGAGKKEANIEGSEKMLESIKDSKAKKHPKNIDKSNN